MERNVVNEKSSFERETVGDCPQTRTRILISPGSSSMALSFTDAASSSTASLSASPRSNETSTPKRNRIVSSASPRSNETSTPKRNRILISQRSIENSSYPSTSSASPIKYASNRKCNRILIPPEEKKSGELVSDCHNKKCCVAGCTSKSSEYSLYRFPNERTNLDIYRKWIEAIGRDELFNIPPETVRNKCRVCEKHFVKADYIPLTGLDRKLKVNAMPHIDVPSTEQCTPRWKRKDCSGCNLELLTIERLQVENERLRALNSNLLRAHLQAKIKRLENMNSGLQAEVKQLKSSHSSLQAETDKLKSSIVNLQTEMGQVDSFNSYLQSERLNLWEERNDLRKEKSKLKKENRQLREKLKNKKNVSET